MRVPFLVLMLFSFAPIVQAEKRTPRIYSAGSFRSSLEDVLKEFHHRTGISFTTVYGPSGKLRQDIEAGDGADVFASASIEHTEALLRQGLLKNSFALARNSLCLLAAPGVQITQESLLNTMLDPAMRLGTSTPGIDPAGDYTWSMFRNAETVRQGAYKALDRKALRLLGNPSLPLSPPRSVNDLLTEHQVDLFVTYCPSAAETVKKVPGATSQRFPKNLNVTAVYGIGAGNMSDARAERLIRFILSADGQQILIEHGLEPGEGKFKDPAPP